MKTFKIHSRNSEVVEGPWVKNDIDFDTTLLIPSKATKAVPKYSLFVSIFSTIVMLGQVSRVSSPNFPFALLIAPVCF